MKKITITFLATIFCCLLAGCQEGKAPSCAHQFATKVTQEATCHETGTLEHTCQLCGLSVTQITPAADHRFTETVTKEATCSEEGVLTHVCELCGASETSPIAPVLHTFDFYSPEPSRCTLCGETIDGAAADPENPWYGKNWVALGTSLSSEAQGTYIAPLAERSGMTATTLGIPGGTAVAQVLHKVQTADLSQADLITVEFGVNDWFANVPLGTVYDTVPYLATDGEWSNQGTEEGSFAGACYQIFTTLQKQAPNAVIVFLTDSTGREGQDNCSWEKTNYNGLLQRDYTEMAMQCARYAGIRVIDAGSMSMINRHHPQYLADHIHHSQLGGRQYALTVWMELKDIPPLLKAE